MGQCKKLCADPKNCAWATGKSELHPCNTKCAGFNLHTDTECTLFPPGVKFLAGGASSAVYYELKQGPSTKSDSKEQHTATETTATATTTVGKDADVKSKVDEDGDEKRKDGDAKSKAGKDADEKKKEKIAVDEKSK